MKKQSVMLVCSMLILAACGGGGGSGSDSGGSSENAAVDRPGDRPTNQDWLGVFLSFEKNHITENGGFISLDHDRRNITSTFRDYAVSLPSGRPDATVAHVNIYGSRDGIENGSVNVDGKSYKTFAITDDSYRYSQAGIIIGGGDSGIFYRGQIFQQYLPPSGQVSYKGDAIMAFVNKAYSDEKEEILRYEVGSMNMNVDFGKKEFDIAVKSPSYSADTSGVVWGNSNFSTIPNVHPTPGKYHLTAHGVFYGPSGYDEVAGELGDSKAHVRTLFSGKRE